MALQHLILLSGVIMLNWARMVGQHGCGYWAIDDDYYKINSILRPYSLDIRHK